LSAGIDSVGLFHRFSRSVLGDGLLVDGLFYAAFLAGIHMVIAVMRDIRRRWRDGSFGMPLFLGLSIISFLLVMLFPHYCWEKYFLPVLPLAAIFCLTLSGSRAH
jgi:hypothetical protein